MSAVDQLLQTGTLAALVAIAWSLSRIARHLGRFTRTFVHIVKLILQEGRK